MEREESSPWCVPSSGDGDRNAEVPAPSGRSAREVQIQRSHQLGV